jgi:surfactin synthase thioesterase subunit
VYGLEHPGHSSDLRQQNSYSLPDLARLYADAVLNHLDTVGVKQVVFIGTSFGGVVATEMLHNLSSSLRSFKLLENVKLVLLDAALGGNVAASGFSGLDDIQPQGEIVTEHTDENNSIVLSTPSSNSADTPYLQPMMDASVKPVYRSNIHALQSYSGPDTTALTGIQVLYVLARGDGLVETTLEKKRLWWTNIFPALQWEELQCTHEQLWQKQAVEVINIIHARIFGSSVNV